MRAILNFPANADLIRALVTDDQDLKLMNPKAEIPFNRDQWQELVDPANGHLSFLVLKSEVTVGHFAFLRLNRELHEATLGLVYISPALRKTKASHELMQLVDKMARELLDLRLLRLNVRSTNLAAYHLYLRAGFTEYESNDEIVRMVKVIT